MEGKRNDEKNQTETEQMEKFQNLQSKTYDTIILPIEKKNNS
jgi:hypothetical protein